MKRKAKYTHLFIISIIILVCPAKGQITSCFDSLYNTIAEKESCKLYDIDYLGDRLVLCGNWEEYLNDKDYANLMLYKDSIATPLGKNLKKQAYCAKFLNEKVLILGGAFRNVGESNNISYLAYYYIDESIIKPINKNQKDIVNGIVCCIQIYDSELYIGGCFITKKQSNCSLVKFNPITKDWFALANPEIGKYVYDVEFIGEEIFLGWGNCDLPKAEKFNTASIKKDKLIWERIVLGL